VYFVDTIKPTVRVEPQSSVYTGDSVTLTCELPTYPDGWTVTWKKDGQDLQTRLRIYNLTVSDPGEYQCGGSRRGGLYTEYNDPVRISVRGMLYYPFILFYLYICLLYTERPKATVKVQPADRVLMGERITLTCEIESGDYWNYEWYKDNNLLSDAKRKEYEISNVGQHHAGVYTCKGTQSTGRIYTHTSAAVTLTVSGECGVCLIYSPLLTERPKATVKVQPADHVLMGERVTLTCEIESGDYWNYEWYKNNNLLSDAKRKEYEISNVGQDHAGVYTCKGTQSTGRIYTHTSAAVTLTVSGELKVTPTITSGYEGAVLTGNTMNLYCTLPQSAGWTFYWSKHTQSPEKKTTTNTYTISSVRVSDGGQYRCRAGRGNPVYYTHYSDALWVNVTGDVGNCDRLTESNKAMVNIKPDKQVFTGEPVTLRCDIQAGGDTEWTYSWYKDDSLYPNRRTQEFTISSVTESNAGKYTCRGERTNDLQKSEISDAVTLTVSDVAQAVLSVSPQSWLTEGDSVTLSCEVTGSSTGWTFSWYRAVPYRQGLKQIRDAHGNVMYGVELLSDSRREAGGSYTLSPAALHHTGVYVCRAERGEPAYQTQYSSPQPLWITGTSPAVSLIISPSRSQHFSGHSLSLSCEGQSESTGWRVRRYTHSGEVSDCSSVTGSTCNISALYTSHTGVYWFQSESGGGSDPLNITVHSGDVILDSPVHPVTEGDSLTLHCLYRSTKPSNLTADFYRDGSLLQTQTTGEMIIRTVSKSDEGLYHCKHPEKGESPKSWLSVRGENAAPSAGSGSTGVAVGLAVGLSLTVFLIITLGLVYYCKKRTDDSAAQPSEVTYTEVVTKRKPKGNNEAVTRPDDVIYSQLSMNDFNHHERGLGLIVLLLCGGINFYLNSALQSVVMVTYILCGLKTRIFR
ncbi:hypothetical protein NFI96_031686, partial [Prochilodus magdalenae]